MDSHDIAKALEVWTLQNLFDISIMIGVLALGLALAQAYYRQIEKAITLRLSLEVWKVTTKIIVDVLLVIVVLVGYVVMNPDIMADIKIAIPFCPVATLFFAVALVLRLFYRGHDVGTSGYRGALFCMIIGNVLNVIGFTFVMEAPSGEYLAAHPSPFWEFIKTHLRSNAAPHGLELAQTTFYVCFTLFVVIVAWGLWSALRSQQD